MVLGSPYQKCLFETRRWQIFRNINSVLRVLTPLDVFVTILVSVY